MERSRSLVFLLILVMIFFCMPFYALGAVEPSQSDVFKKMDQISEKLVTYTEQGNFSEAKQQVDELSTLYTQIGSEKKLSIEALAVVTDTIVHAKQSFAAVRADKNKMLWYAYQLRLLTDAFTHPNQPMWKEYQTTFTNQIKKMIDASEKGDQKTLLATFKENKRLYDFLKPCFVINQTPQTIEMLDSIYTFLDKRVDSQDLGSKELRNTLDQLRQIVDNVFLGREMNTFSLYISNRSPIVMITIMSSILVSVLTYVGWRMYRGTQYNT